MLAERYKKNESEGNNSLQEQRAVEADLQAIADQLQRVSQATANVESATVVNHNKPSASDGFLQEQLGIFSDEQLEIADKIAALVASGVEENLVFDQLHIGGVYGEMVRNKILAKKQEREREERLSIFEAQRHAEQANAEIGRRNTDNRVVSTAVLESMRLTQPGQQQPSLPLDAQRLQTDIAQRNARLQVVDSAVKQSTQISAIQQVQQLAQQARESLQRIDKQLRTLPAQTAVRISQLREAVTQNIANNAALTEVQAALKNRANVTAQTNIAIQKVADSIANTQRVTSALIKADKPELQSSIRELKRETESLRAVESSLITQRNLVAQTEPGKVGQTPERQGFEAAQRAGQAQREGADKVARIAQGEVGKGDVSKSDVTKLKPEQKQQTSEAVKPKVAPEVEGRLPKPEAEVKPIRPDKKDLDIKDKIKPAPDKEKKEPRIKEDEIEIDDEELGIDEIEGHDEVKPDPDKDKYHGHEWSKEPPTWMESTTPCRNCTNGGNCAQCAQTALIEEASRMAEVNKGVDAIVF